MNNYAETNAKHIETINKELGEVRDRLVRVETDVAWIKHFFWIVATTSIGAFVTGIINLLI